MKKIFTLLAMAVLAVSANAQNKYEAPGENLEAETTLVDNDDLTVSTVFDANGGSGSTTICGVDFSGWFQLRVAADPTADVPTGTDNGGSTPLVVVAKKAMDFSVYSRRQKGTNGYEANDNKDLLALNQATLERAGNTLELTEGSDVEDSYAFVKNTYHFEPGTYTIYRRGSTMRVYGFTWEVSASTPTIAAPTHDQASDEMTYNDQPIMVIFTPADASHEIYAHFENFPLPSGGMPAVSITPSGSKTLTIDGKSFTLVAPSPMGNVYVVQKGGRLSYVALDPATGIQSEVKSIAFNYPGQSGIADVTVDENAPVEYYNLQGVRVAEPAEGQVVIRRQGNQVSKVVVK